MKTFSWNISTEEKRFPWRIFSIVALVALLIAGYFIYKENYFGGVLFVLIPVILMINFNKTPKKFACRITEDALIINSAVYQINNLEHFSIIDNTLIIQPQKKSPVYAPINREDENEVRNTMSQYLKEAPHEESFSEIINRILKIH